MSSASSTLRVSRLAGKGDGVMELLNSVEKITMSNSENPLKFLFDQKIVPANLKEKFLCATFEIVAEKGADALSASELIKRTKSSKGALFHHFQTIDHLCIESLDYFRQHISRGNAQDNCQNIDQFLEHVMTVGLRRQSTRYYVHLVNFFRDRAVRDERYRAPLKSAFQATVNLTVDRVMHFLNPGADRAVVFRKIIFFFMIIERTSYHRLLYDEPTAFETELRESLQFSIKTLKDLK